MWVIPRAEAPLLTFLTAKQKFTDPDFNFCKLCESESACSDHCARLEVEQEVVLLMYSPALFDKF